jgi:hypothetical protein
MRKSRCALGAVLVFWVAWIDATGQVRGKDSVQDVLRRGEIVASNIQVAIISHLTEDADFHPTKQEPEEKMYPANLLVFKDGTVKFDWTTGQEARHLIEEMRQGVHELHSALKPRGLDVVVFAGVKETWPSLRDIACAEFPGIRYYDLDGFEQYCPPDGRH